MRTLIGTILTCGILVAASLATAQRPGGGVPEADQKQGDDLATRMLAFDRDKDGKLTRAEVTDERLLGLFDRADVDKDGFVTKAELISLEAKEKGNDRGGRGFGPPGGPGGPMMGPPRPGEVLPRMVQQRLNLTAEQKGQLDSLQKDVDARLEKILTSEQRTQLKAMRDRGPGGFGPPGGGRGPRGGGPPPDGGGPPPPPDRQK
jgi:hypothetical protein